jgi:hypothetical protein
VITDETRFAGLADASEKHPYLGGHSRFIRGWFGLIILSSPGTIALQKDSMRAKKIALFLLLAYAIAWTLEFGFFALGGRVNTGGFTVIALLCMFAPATAALITQKLIWKEPMRDLGLSAPRMAWLGIAWLLPLTLVIVAFALSLLVTGAIGIATLLLANGALSLHLRSTTFQA